MPRGRRLRHAVAVSQGSSVGRLHELTADGRAQAVVATHSPIIAALPGADLYEVGDWGYRRTTWEDLELVGHWRRFLADPERYIRHVLVP
jgi:predicted ATPase